MRPRISSFSSASSSGSFPSTSSASSLDEDDLNVRVTPCWDSYKMLFERHGFRLDTSRDVKQYYERIWKGSIPDTPENVCHKEGYARACRGSSDALCKDAGLPDTLFRGTRVRDEKRIVVKAACLRSRQFEVICLLTTPPLRDDPMNHTIPVLDLIRVPEADLGFIVQEEWSSQLITPEDPCSIRDFLRAVRQCIEGLVFMHKHRIAHLDISLRNVLTDYEGHHRYIDFEMSRRYSDESVLPRICGCRGTEMPPEIERGGVSDPFKVDVWALAVVMLRACNLAGHDLPGLVQLTRPMLHESFEARPSAREVLLAFDCMAPRIVDEWSVR
ncbi:kinase-like protein [Phellopilus nigrolimitatus]|nr:kinase-like protein [Phellopilus nigrolimitatus]